MRTLAVIVALLSGCAATPVKPAIPDDLKLTCYRGVWATVSESAGEAVLFGVRCERQV